MKEFFVSIVKETKRRGGHLTMLEDSGAFFLDFLFFWTNICSYSSVDSRSLLVGFRWRLFSELPV